MLYNNVHYVNCDVSTMLSWIGVDLLPRAHGGSIAFGFSFVSVHC